jgi:hypothetical protein
LGKARHENHEAKASYVSISPQEDRRGTASEVGQVEGAAQESGLAAGLVHAVRREETLQLLQV